MLLHRVGEPRRMTLLPPSFETRANALLGMTASIVDTYVVVHAAFVFFAS